MNNFAKKIIMERRDERRDGRRDYSESRRDYNRDYEHGRDYSRGEYGGEFYGECRDERRGRDYARGEKYTGHYGIGGDRYDGRIERDYNSRNDEKIRLSDEEMSEWKHSMKNADGSTGEHFVKRQIIDEAEKIGVKYKNYTEKDLCLTANMLYSDYCEALKNFIPPDMEAMIYTNMAKLFLEDEDAISGSEKLAIYYYSIVEK